MSFKTTVVLSILFGSAGNWGFAADVEGAFGFQFGQSFAGNGSLEFSSLENGTVTTYDVTPPVPNPNFETYSLELFPHTRNIYKISASKNFVTYQNCIIFRDFVTGLLVTKYGGPAKYEPEISVRCSAESFEFSINYVDGRALDNYLKTLEKQQLPINDDSGL